MIDEVPYAMPDSYERWKNEADARAERSKARRREAEDRRARRILPGKTEWFHATLIVVGMLMFLALLAAVMPAR